MTSLRHCCSLCLLLVLLAACGTFSGKTQRPNSGNEPPLTVSRAGSYKVGEPYEVNGVWYYPNEDYSYDESGIASWYGPGFHGNKTANGEIFDSNELTAAHPTLPMPSLARVSNLDNGRSVVLRINDRGPYAGGRLIDVSRRAAQLLGFEKIGTAKVRVQVLADESKAIAAAARRYGTDQASKAYANATFSNAPITKVVTRQEPARRPFVAPQLPPPERVLSDDGVTPMELPVLTNVPVKPDAKIFVQAGAFTMAENAGKLQRELRRFGDVHVDQAKLEDILFYRVRIGPLASADAANKILKQVAQSGVPAAKIVVD